MPTTAPTRSEQAVSDPMAALSLPAMQALAADPARRERMALVRRHIAALTADQAATGASYETELAEDFEALAHLAGL